MIKIDKHIEIVRSTMNNLSSMSDKSCQSILEVLEENFTQVGVSIINNLSDLDNLVELRPDLVFLGMEFIPHNPKLGINDPKKIWLAEYLDNNEIENTGSSRRAHELSRDKSLAKQRVLDAGLNTSQFYVINKSAQIDEHQHKLEFPVFIKPSNRGGGVGIDSNSLVNNIFDLEKKVTSIRMELNSDSIIENYLPGREFSVSILKNNDTDDFLVMPIELIAPSDNNGARILGGDTKSQNTEQAIEVTDVILKSRVSALALSVFKSLGARDYGRIDIRLDANGTPHFLEANLIPSLIENYGSFPKSCLLISGINYKSMIMQIVNIALNRTRKIGLSI